MQQVEATWAVEAWAVACLVMAVAVVALVVVVAAAWLARVVVVCDGIVVVNDV